MKKGFFLLGLVAILFSCGGKKKQSEKILPPDKMGQVLWDVIRVDAFTTGYIRKDSTRNAAEENARLQLKVFAEHKVTRELFYTSFDHYKNHPAQFKIILDSLVNRQARERNSSLIQSN